MSGKLILIEGTDCSGKQTQSELLVKKLKKAGYKACLFSFPMYDSPTGKIIAGPYLGKESVCPSWFKEGAVNVKPKIALLYYAADRVYNIDKINDKLNDGYVVVLDRYTMSNMAHQGGKFNTLRERLNIYKWIDDLEFNFLQLPRPDGSILLYMPSKYAQILKKDRLEKPDEHEKNEVYLKKASKAYLEIADIYNFKVINCFKKNQIRSIEDINEELFNHVISLLI